MKNVKYFFGSFFLALLLTFIGFVLVVNYCGRGVCEQPWIRELYPLKTHFAKTKKGPKIIVIGGSSSFFGISGEKLQEYTGMEVINFAMSILVPMRFYEVDLEQNVREGDVVVLPLELTNHYLDTAEKNFSNLGISLLFSVMPEAQKTLTLPELASLYFQYGLSWINTSLFHKDGPLMRLKGSKMKQGVFDGVYRETYVASLWEQSQGKKGQCGWYSDLSAQGDWLIDAESKPTEIQPYPLPASVSDEFIRCYRRLRRLTEERHATLLLVWPNNYFYAEQSGFAAFREMLKKHGIKLCGRPERTAIPKTLYHDPIHHVNRQGAELRTYELAKTICRETGRPLKKCNAAWPFIVFADAPEGYFPGVKPLRLYDTGVRIAQKKFPVRLNLPANLRGKPLAVEAIVLPEEKNLPVFTSVTVDGHPCRVTETRHPERAEVLIEVPSGCTKGETLTLECAVDAPAVGLERAYLRAAVPTPVLTFKSGFSVPEAWGRWSDGKRAEVSLAIPPQLRGKNLEAHWAVRTFVHEKKPVCRFRLLTNGRLLKEFSSDRFDNAFSMRLPADLTAAPGLPLTIEIDDPRSPQELGISGDARKLGVGIRSVTLEAVK